MKTSEARCVMEKLATESNEGLVLGREDVRVLKDIFVKLLNLQA